jgi:exo-beta-1,3-glucanase (GH17 family)
MNKYKFFFLLIIVIIIGSCNENESLSNENPFEKENINFGVNNNYILKNNLPFQIKGVVYVPGYPGYLPWEIENSTSLPVELRNSISTDINNIKAMGANTIRFWGAPRYCYEALKNVGDLNFIQVIWIKGDEPDFQNPAFKENTKTYIREVIDRIYSVFNDNSPPLVAITIGNELSETSILSTNAAHPYINSFKGNYIITDSNITATEAFIAEMADFARTYEFSTYGNKSLLTYSNEIRTADIIDIPFLDFISHNAYSYAVPYYRPGTVPGSSSGTLFQGWIEEIKSKHPNKPLLITETGLSVSPNASHAGPPNYGYGGNTESEQATGLLQNINDINTSALPTAGVCIHEYSDAWWKFGLEDSYSQDPDDVEEWFGIVKLKNSTDGYTTEFRNSYNAIKNAWQLNNQ